MDAAPLLAGVAAAAALALAAWRRAAPHAAACSAPHVPGLPLLGSTLALGRWGAAFLSACRGAVGGDAFCLHLGFGQRMLFLWHPALIARFMTAPEADVAFKPAVRRFTQRVYGLPGEEFGAAHETLLARLRHLLVPSELQRHAEGLLDTALPLVRQWAEGGGQVELWAASKALVFQSAGRQLFGRAFFDRWGGDRLQSTFFVFEEHFEIAASPVPHLLLPAFRRSRADLLRMLRASIAAGDFGGTAAGALLEGCGLREGLHPNVLLAVLWASQANSVAAMFWAIAFLQLPENVQHLAAVRADVAAAVADEEAAGGSGGSGGGGGGGGGGGASSGGGGALRAALVRLSLDRRAAAARCVAEAVRLRVHSVAIRLVARDGLDLELPAAGGGGSKGGGGGAPRRLRVPRGTVLAICPFVSHHDERLFGGDGAPPWAYQPGRAPIQLEPGAVATSTAGFGFGGGFWRCPGRFFAEMELSLLLMAVVHSLDLQLPPPDAAAGAHGGADGKAASGGGGLCGRALAAAAAAAAALLPRERVVFGGAAGGCGGAFEEEAARWRRSGDPGARLPPAELRRLVGFKVPAGELLVRATLRGR
ncbi:MAG: cytochrome P450 [Monoraphidium minutum]|nr:MAG: cytochrome P450 [Monoraphidium minutum]